MDDKTKGIIVQNATAKCYWPALVTLDMSQCYIGGTAKVMNSVR